MPGLIPDLLTRLKWRFNIYFDTDQLTLAIALDIRTKLEPLCERVRIRNIYEMLERFSSKHAKQLQNVTGTGETNSSPSNEKLVLMKDFRKYHESQSSYQVSQAAHIEDSMDPSNASGIEVSHERLRIDSVHTAWSNSLDFMDSPLRRIADLLFSVVPHAADLERVWSTTALILTDRRNRTLQKNVLQILNAKLSILEDASAHRQKEAEDTKRRNEEKARLDRAYEAIKSRSDKQTEQPTVEQGESVTPIEHPISAETTGIDVGSGVRSSGISHVETASAGGTESQPGAQDGTARAIFTGSASTIIDREGQIAPTQESTSITYLDAVEGGQQSNELLQLLDDEESTGVSTTSSADTTGQEQQGRDWSKDFLAYVDAALVKENLQ